MGIPVITVGILETRVSGRMAQCGEDRIYSPALSVYPEYSARAAENPIRQYDLFVMPATFKSVAGHGQRQRSWLTVIPNGR